MKFEVGYTGTTGTTGTSETIWTVKISKFHAAHPLIAHVCGTYFFKTSTVTVDDIIGVSLPPHKLRLFSLKSVRYRRFATCGSLRRIHHKNASFCTSQ